MKGKEDNRATEDNEMAEHAASSGLGPQAIEAMREVWEATYPGFRSILLIFKNLQTRSIFSVESFCCTL